MIEKSGFVKAHYFYPVLCLTHRCNLNCIYCYQNHDSNDMTLDTAKKCIDWIFANYPENTEAIEIGFIGGEPLLKFNLIKKIYNYVCEKKVNKKYYFFATTNGTLLNDEMKSWFTEHKHHFVLGLSLDGNPESHNHNRSDSFEKIDINFFLKNWPFQNVKMTISPFSIYHLAENIKYLYSIGFKYVSGVNLCEGNFDWNKEEYIKCLIPQLEELVQFYVENSDIEIDQMLNKNIGLCEKDRTEKKKFCGIGTRTAFFDVDGIKRPCSFCTPMTFDLKSLEEICRTDFSNDGNFVDDECFENCYIYPLCSNCSGNNYLKNHSFKIKDKSKCRIQKLISIYIADLQVRRMIKNPEKYSDLQKLKTLDASYNIKQKILPEFREYFF